MRKCQNFLQIFIILTIGAGLWGCRNPGAQKFPTTVDVRDPNSRAVDSVQAQSSGSSAIAGQVVVAGNCQPASINVTIRTNSQSVYEVQIPTGGSFEFHTVPGLYRVAAAGMDGCVADTEATVSTGAVTRLRLSLARPAVPNLAIAPTTQNCAWWDSVCLARYYPGSGSGLAIFPNVYLSGKEGDEVEVQLHLRDHATLLAGSPVLGGIRGDSNAKFSQGFWGTKLGLWSEDDAGLSINQLEILNHAYPYLYYDLRFDASMLQSEWGFCSSTAKEAIENVKSFVVKNAFPERIVRDIEAGLLKKLTHLAPQSRGVCIYPQDAVELERVLELQTTPAASEIKRLWFVVTTWNAHPEKSTSAGLQSARFTRGPLRTLALSHLPKRWSQKMKFNEGRALASDSSKRPLIVYEWGVVFLISVQDPLQKEKI